jgi:hypothetical protein
LNVRSCPKAKNVTLTVRTYAGTEELLNTMVLQRDTLPVGGERLVLLAPSFDWSHCQRAVFDLVVPENAGLDIKAQGLLARVDVHASKSAVRNLVIATSVAQVDIHSSELSGNLRIDSELGMIRTRDVTVHGDVRTELRVGYLETRHIVTQGTLSTTLRIGCAKFMQVEAQKGFTHSSELAHVSMWNIKTPALTSRVDYGALTVTIASEFAGHFISRSPYGFLQVTRGNAVGSRLVLAQETLALIEGSVKADAHTVSSTPEKTVTLDAVYGRVDLSFDDTKNERSHWHNLSSYR